MEEKDKSMISEGKLKHGLGEGYEKFCQSEKFKNNYPIIEKELKEEFYANEVDKSLLEQLALYRTIREHGDDCIRTGLVSPLPDKKIMNGFWRTYRHVKKEENKILRQVRAQLPKKLEATVNIGEFIKGLKDEDRERI